MNFVMLTREREISSGELFPVPGPTEFLAQRESFFRPPSHVGVKNGKMAFFYQIGGAKRFHRSKTSHRKFFRIDTAAKNGVVYMGDDGRIHFEWLHSLKEGGKG